MFPILKTLSCLLLVGAFALASPALRADGPPPAPPGYRNVALKQGDKTAYIQVKDSGNPYKGVNDSGDSTPDHFSFNQTSPMAHQKYDTGDTASAHDTGSYRDGVEHTFLTKSYFTDSAEKTTPGLNTAVPLNAAAGYSTRALDADKNFATTRADVDQKKAASDSETTSSYQGQTAVLGGHDVATFSYPMAKKTFEGREAEAVKRDLAQMNEGLLGTKDLPSRPLTVDEVRALINHGVKPDTDTKPAEQSKALNDPSYTPDPAPPPLKAQPGDDHRLSDDNDMIPPPGTLARPQDQPAENSEPLPQ